MDWNKLKQNTADNTFFKKTNYEDSRFWKLSRDENDNGSALIRLLPDQEGIPLVKIFEHSIKVFHKGTNKNRYFIQPSPSSIGLPCPASEEWERYNALGTEESKKTARLFSRRTQYIANILVVNDPANPQNNGKVFLWKFGMKLLDKFSAALEPSDTDKAMGVQPVELFDLMKGANIMLKSKKVAGFVNYDDTQVQQPTASAATNEAAEAIWKQSHGLKEFLSPEYYLPYAELKKKLDWTFGKEAKPTQDRETPANKGGLDAMAGNVMANAAAAVTSIPVEAPTAKSVEAPAAPVEAPVDTNTSSSTSSGSEDLSFLDDL